MVRRRARQPLVAAVLATTCLLAHAAGDPGAARLYEDALQRFDKKDYGGAVVQLKNALQIDKSMLPVHVLLGKALLAKGEVGAAEVALTEALRLGVNRAEVAAPLARALLAQGKLLPVLEDPRFALAGLSPAQQVELLLVRVGAYIDLGQPNESLKAVEQAAQLDPRSPAPWMAAVPVHIRAGRFGEALAAVDKAIALAPKSAEARYLRGTVWHTQGHVANAGAEYTKALELNPLLADALIARAGISLDLNRSADAQRDIEQAIRSWPGDPRAAYLSAVIAERAGDNKTAKARLADVTNLIDPIPIEQLKGNRQVLILGGLAHHGLGQFEKAKPYLEAVQREQPGSPVTKLLGQIYVADGNVDRAVETLEGYLKTHPSDTQALTLLAAAQMSKGRHARASQVVRDALKSQDKAVLRSVLGLSLVLGGKEREALPELEAAFAKDPNQLQAGTTLVGLYLDLKNTKRAVETAEALAKRRPDHAGVQNLLGLARLRAGNTAGARTAFEASARLDSAFLDPRLNLARVDLAADKLDAAAARLSELLKVNDKHIDTLLLAAQLESRRGRQGEATRLLTRAADLSTGPTQVAAAHALLDHHLRTGHIAEAREAANRLNLKAPDDVMVMLANARVALAAKKPDAARPILVSASGKAGFDTGLLTKVAALQIAAGDPKGAAYSLGKALKDEPQNVPAIALLTEAETLQGEFASAEKRARELMKRHPRLGVGSALLGDVAIARGQLPAAIDAYRESHRVEPGPVSALRLQRALSARDVGAAIQFGAQWLKTHPGDLAVRRLQGDNQLLAGNMAAARLEYEQLLKALPNNGDVLNNYAHVLLALKDVAGASKAATAALAAKPEAPNVIGTAGWVAFKLGQQDRALQLLRDARLRDPSNNDTRYYLAAVLASAGRAGEAREELKAALGDGNKFAMAKDAQTLLDTLR